MIRLDCYDSPQQVLPLERGGEAIDLFLDGGGRCLVHCNAGQSRSASIVMYYLMSEGHTLQESFEYVGGASPTSSRTTGSGRSWRRWRGCCSDSRGPPSIRTGTSPRRSWSSWRDPASRRRMFWPPWHDLTVTANWPWVRCWNDRCGHSRKQMEQLRLLYLRYCTSSYII